MHKLGIASAATVLLLSGAAHAQLRQGDQTSAATTTYAVEGIALGSRIKSDGPIIRDYKCSPSDQFNGLTWCQKSRRENGREGSVEASYSLAHAKNGTVLYVNRRQQPAVLDAREADRDIQSYARKFGGQPRITKMPHRAGTDALIATWGLVELEPLDADGVRLLAEGKSPKRGLLIDFVGNFTRSAREGLPIYRIVGGAGFVWAGSFDQKARGTLRVAAVDASALQPLPEPTQPPTARQTDVQQPSRSELPQQPPSGSQPAARPPPQSQPPTDLPPEPQPVQPPEKQALPTQPAEIQPSQTQAELPAAAVDTRKETEAVVARLQAELSAAVEAKAQAELARTRAEKAAQEAKSDAEIVRKKLDVARNDAAAASDEIDRLRASGGPPVSYAKITLIWISITGALLCLVWAFSKILSYRRMAKATKVLVGEVMAPPPAGWQDPTEAKLDEDDLVKRMAHTLGVEDPSVPLSEEEALMYERRRLQAADDRQSDPQSVTRGDEGSIQVIYLPDRSSQTSSGHDRDTTKSIVPATGNEEDTKSPQEARATQSK